MNTVWQARQCSYDFTFISYVEEQRRRLDIESTMSLTSLCLGSCVLQYVW